MVDAGNMLQQKQFSFLSSSCLVEMLVFYERPNTQTNVSIEFSATVACIPTVSLVIRDVRTAVHVYKWKNKCFWESE